MSDDTYSTKGPICPDCGHLHQPDEPFYYDESVTQMQCEACDETFKVLIFTQTSWTTGDDA